MKVHVILFISFLGIIISCTQKSDLHSSIDVVNIGQQMENPSEVPIRDFAKSVEIVQLETNDSLLIRDIYNLHLFDNNLLIDGRLFDRFGKFLNQVYRIGEGPGEVTKGANVIKVKDNKIYVLDFAGKVNVYSPDGKCLETIKSPANFYFEFQPLDNGNFVGFKSNFKGDEWELYNIKEDRTEQHNLIGKYPEMAKELETAYFEWADKSDVLYFQKMWNTYNKNRRKDFKEYKTR
ncbi:MAG: hypothetical protein BHV68_21540 [Bacteroidales bacterium 43_8]|nr:MAG: hypothetical protein BHV68_21540 [Bacteroidales bacterium 43_8]